MWKLYASSNESVCILSSYRLLRLCLPQCVYVGEVNYINYDTQQFSVDNLFKLLREVVWVILDQFRTAVFCGCCRCGHVGNALALSLMSTAVLDVRAVES